MPRFLTISFVALALLVGAAGAAPTAHAQSSVENGGLCGADGDCISDVCSENGVCAAAPADREGNSTDASTAGASVADTVTGQNNTATLPAPPPGIEAFNPVMIAIMTLFAWLVGVAAITLDNTVFYTVVTMGDYVKNLTAVGVAWRILRDLSNIAFIFGFLAIGITVILDVDWYGRWTQMLPKLLIAAVFLNFSLFITEAVIDTGNLFATQFYTQINGGQAAGAKSFGTSEINNEGISNKIMGQLGLQTIYGNGAVNPEVFKATNSWIIGFMGIILFIVTAFVMFSLAFILITRFVILVLLIIAAPIGFAGYAIPQLKGIASMWKDELIKQTITAPVLFLLLYIALAIITDVSFLTGFGANPDWTGWITGGSSGLEGFASAVLSFLVAIGLLLAVTIFAKKLGAFGAGFATKWAGRATFGATAFGASALLNSGALGARKALQRFAPNSRFTRIASRPLRFAEKARMDVRSIPGIGAGLALGGAGEAAKPIAKSALGRVRQVGDWGKKTGQESDRQFDQETRIPRLRAAIAANNQADISKIVGNMSDKELEDVSVQRLITNNPVAIAALPKGRFDKLIANDTLTDAQKENLKKRRDEGLIANYTEGGGQAIGALTNEAVSQLPDAVLLAEISNQPGDNVYKHLSLKQLNAIYKAEKIKDATATTIGAFLSTDQNFITYFKGRTPQQQQDLNAAWHMTLPITVPNSGGDQPPPPGFQQNPGGRIFVRTP